MSFYDPEGHSAPTTGSTPTMARRSGYDWQEAGQPRDTRLRLAALIAVGVVAALGVVVAGFMLGRGSGPGTPSAGPSSAASPSVSQPAASPSPTASGSPSASASASPIVKTGFVENPVAADGYDFGLLRGVARKGNSIVLTLDRATWLMGADAEKYYKEHPKLEPMDYAVVNENPKLREFVIDPDAEIYGVQVLSDRGDVQPQELTPAQLLHRAATPAGDGVLIWLRHRKGLDGDVTYLAEQFVP